MMLGVITAMKIHIATFCFISPCSPIDVSEEPAPSIFNEEKMESAGSSLNVCNHLSDYTIS
jgi:hypothetical protein